VKGERLASGGAVLAAAAASLCCVGPLVFVLFGLGTFGAAAVLEPARPYLLAAAGAFLAFGFYQVYFRRRAAPSCAPGDACVTKPVSRSSHIMLWMASAAVLAFALSPYYAGPLARRLTARPAAPASATQSAARATFKVSGMTCAGCEATIKLALEKTPGVRGAEVSYDRGEAAVEYDPAATTPEKLRDAINETGYKAELKR
jgi:mercuric ion transport protein